MFTADERDKIAKILWPTVEETARKAMENEQQSLAVANHFSDCPRRGSLNRTVIAASAGAGTVVAPLAAGGAGYLAGNSHAAGRTVTRTVTVTKTAPAKIVTRWKTNTKTVTVTATATPQTDPGALRCAEEEAALLMAEGQFMVNHEDQSGMTLYPASANGFTAPYQGDCNAYASQLKIFKGGG
jgi:hypothetical protein